MVSSVAVIDVTLDSGVRVVASPGEISVGIGRLLNAYGDAFVGDIVDRAMQCDHITKIDVNCAKGEIAIEYDRNHTRLAEILKSLSRSLADRSQSCRAFALPGSSALSRQNAVIAPSQIADSDIANRFVPLSALWRLVNLAAASGSFVMSLIGLITPGIPTVPFVLATSYFLVRSSPALNDRFRQSRLFGQMARDWQDRGGLRRSTKVRLVVITCGLVSITLVVAELSLPLVAVIAVMGTLGLSSVLCLPTISDEPTLIAGAAGTRL